MRIAHGITRLIVGGAQENTLLTCADLIHRYGDRVLLITGPGLGPEGDLVGEAERRGIPVRVLPPLRREIHPLKPCEVAQVSQAGVRHVSSIKVQLLQQFKVADELCALVRQWCVR